jgi:imidazolonepropionase-like amidohydrolase
MISGLMDFDRAGVLTEPGLSAEQIRELIHIAHEEGFAVMAHANGARTVEAAAIAGVDSVEHGAYQDEDSMLAMAENGTVWVPTLSTVGNLRGKGRFREEAVREILDSALRNVAFFAEKGGLVAPGSDAGAWAVPHGCTTEFQLLKQALGEKCQGILERGSRRITEIF